MTRWQNFVQHCYASIAFAWTLACPVAAHAQHPQPVDNQPLRPAVGTETWASTDSDGTEVVKVLGRALWQFEGKDSYAGLAFEHAWFSPATGEADESDRIYLDLADTSGSNWRWNARIGTDGKTILGNAELRKADWSQSFFVEREIVETEQGLDRRIFYTFAGVSSDIIINDANTLAVTAGIQEFSGKNERFHFRGKIVHAVKAEVGLSAQLDARYYHSTEPSEFDYFSPRNFVRLVPLLQLRRFSTSGWMYAAAAGVGTQHSTGSNWQTAKFGQVRVESPRSLHRLDIFAEAVFANDSISGGADYDYIMGRAGATFQF